MVRASLIPGQVTEGILVDKALGLEYWRIREVTRVCFLPQLLAWVFENPLLEDNTGGLLLGNQTSHFS